PEREDRRVPPQQRLHQAGRPLAHAAARGARPAGVAVVSRTSARRSRVIARGAPARAAPTFEAPRHLGAVMSKGLGTWRRRLVLTAAIFLLPASAAATAATASAGPAADTPPQPRLVGRAVLPAATFADGPPAGNFVV